MVVGKTLAHSLNRGGSGFDVPPMWRVTAPQAREEVLPRMVVLVAPDHLWQAGPPHTACLRWNPPLTCQPAVLGIVFVMKLHSKCSGCVERRKRCMDVMQVTRWCALLILLRMGGGCASGTLELPPDLQLRVVLEHSRTQPTGWMGCARQKRER